MGGSRAAWINEPANLITLCGSGTTQCHGLVESNPTWAQAHGWSVRRTSDPASVPVWTWRGWVRLAEDGTQVVLDGYPGVDDCACGCRPTETPAGLWVSPAMI